LGKKVFFPCKTHFTALLKLEDLKLIMSNCSDARFDKKSFFDNKLWYAIADVGWLMTPMCKNFSQTGCAFGQVLDIVSIILFGLNLSS